MDNLFAAGPVNTVIVEVPEDLQITINTPATDGKNAGYEVYMSGGCTLPGATVEFRGGASGFSVCQSNNTWEANVDISGAPVGNVTVEAYLIHDDESSAAAVRTLNKTNSDCDSSSARSAVYAAGDGGATPYSICTSAQFNNVRLNPTANFVLKNDLDMQNVPFTPIPNTFRGTLDGGDFIIKRLFIYDLSSSDAGMFKGVRDGALIKNLTIESANVTGSAVAGIVAGRVLGTGATIQNLSISGRVAATGNWVGGIVAYVDTGAPLTVSDVTVDLTSLTAQNFGGGVLGGSHAAATAISVTNANISGSLSITNSYLGGIAGLIQSASLSLSNVHSTAHVTVSGGTADNYIGGILGATTNGSGSSINIVDCSSSGTVSASGSFVGGVAGRYTGTKLWNCEVTGPIVGDSTSRAISYVGGLAGWTNVNDTDVYQSNVKVDISVTGVSTGTYFGGLFGSFIGTRIEDSHAHGDTAQSLPGTITIASGDGATTGSDHIGGAIGRLYVNNGVTTTVTNSSADVDVTHDGYNSDTYVGGYVGNLTAPDGTTASIVVVSDSSATGDVIGNNRYVGGWAGRIYVPRGGSNATLTNVSAGGKVQVSTRNAVTPHYIGGLVGYAQSRDAGGDVQAAPIGHQWTNVRASGNVTVDSATLGGNYVGGLAGYLQTGRTGAGGGSSTLNQVYASGNVSALSSGANFNYVGGLFGRVYTGNSATTAINSTSGQTYAIGHVTGHGNNIGGLIGAFDNGTSSISTITDAYSNGNVVGRQNVGGAIGNLTNGSSSTMTVNNLRSHDSNSATPANTVSATANSAGGLVGYAVSSATTFLISNSEAIAAVSSLGGYAGGLIGQDRDNVDLDGCAAFGTVDSPYPNVGGLTGGTDRTGRDWNDVEASGAVTTSVSGSANNLFVGGLSGYMRGTIVNARAHGDVQIVMDVGATINQAIVGGLVGYGNSLTIANGLARGNVTYSAVSGNRSYTGGLIGLTNGSVTRSFATGDVEGGNSTGGLIGQTSSTVSYSFAAGDVSGTRWVGGLVGNHTTAGAGSIDYTYALGSVERNSGTSTDYFGQLVGYCNGGVGDAKVTNSYYNASTSLLIAPIVGQSACNSANAARSLSDSNMRSPGSGFAGWDFAGTDPEDWRYPTAFTKKGTATVYPYPILYWAFP